MPQSRPQQETQRLLITGASGLIGRHLLKNLAGQYQICALDRITPEGPGVLSSPRIEWIELDITSANDLFAVSERIQAGGSIDFVIHLAGYYDFTGEDSPEYQRVNVEGTRNLLELSRHLQPRRFVFASSVIACDFEPRARTVAETTPPDGVTPYSRSKKAGEQMTRELSSEVPACIVRFAAVFTDWCEYVPLDSFLSIWLTPGWRQRILAGRGESAIPYLHAEDAALFVSRLLEQHQQLDPFEVLIASTDGAISHSDLHAAATASHYGRPVAPIFLPSFVCRGGLWGLAKLNRLGRRPGFERPWMGRYIDCRMEVDASRTREILGWRPSTSLEILRRMPILIENRRGDPEQWLQRNHRTKLV